MATREKQSAPPPSIKGKSPVELRFYQLDIDFGGRPIRFSDWGSVRLGFLGRGPVLYFNLSLRGLWAVRNVPVLSREGAGVRQDTWFSFPLGNAAGTRVRSVCYGCTLSGRPSEEAPDSDKEAKVRARLYRLREGTRGPGRGGIRVTGAAPLEGGEADGPKVVHKDFPNQPCGNNECVPTAISNSLKFLNKENKLGIPDDDISIGGLKGPTKWKAGVGRKGGCPAGWQNGKRDYVKKKKWPIETGVVNDPDDYGSEIFDAVQRGCDVEIIANHHCVAVTGAQKLKNGKYSLDLSHDPKQQNKADDPVTETATYDPHSNTAVGGPAFIKGQEIDLVVIECPKKKKKP
jgi:hypothetical protein